MIYNHTKGYGGVDICFGCSNYRLSFLLKGTITNNKIHKQIETKNSIINNQSGTPFSLEKTNRTIDNCGATTRIFSGLKEIKESCQYNFAFFYSEDNGLRQQIINNKSNSYSKFSRFVKVY